MPAFRHELAIRVGAQSHPGRMRVENQDCIGRSSTAYGELFILADGVGGYGGGAEAAEFVVQNFIAHLNQTQAANAADALRAAGRDTGRELWRRGNAPGGAPGMSSTVVAALIQHQEATIAHAGDSRAYLVRDGRLLPLP